jgi:hypothetical protein
MITTKGTATKLAGSSGLISNSQVSALQNDLEFLVFGQLKFFAVGLAEDDPDNFYMEREWRVPEGLAFGLDDIARIIMPRDFADQFRVDVSGYSGPITIAEETPA